MSLVRFRRNMQSDSPDTPIKLTNRLETYLADNYELTRAIAATAQVATSGSRYVLRQAAAAALAMQEDAHRQVDRSPVPADEAAAIVGPLLNDGQLALRANTQGAYQAIAELQDHTFRHISEGRL